MSIPGWAIRLGLVAADEVTSPPSIDDVDIDTAVAANEWAKKFFADLNHPLHLPFPSLADGDKVLSDLWALPDDGWGVFFSWGRRKMMRQFWLNYPELGLKTRWTNGSVSPNKVTREV